MILAFSAKSPHASKFSSDVVMSSPDVGIDRGAQATMRCSATRSIHDRSLIFKTFATISASRRLLMCSTTRISGRRRMSSIPNAPTLTKALLPG